MEERVKNPKSRQKDPLDMYVAAATGRYGCDGQYIGLVWRCPPLQLIYWPPRLVGADIYILEYMNVNCFGIYLQVEIQELKTRSLETSQLECRLKDIYFPYIQVCFK